MCKFRAHRTSSTAKKWDSRGDIFAMAKMGRVSGFWRFLGKYLGTGPKIPYWEPTGENPWISGPEDIPTLSTIPQVLVSEKTTYRIAFYGVGSYICGFRSIFTQISDVYLN